MEVCGTVQSSFDFKEPPDVDEPENRELVIGEDSDDKYEETDEQEENKNTQISCGNLNCSAEINEIKNANLETSEKVEEIEVTNSDHLAALQDEDADHQAFDLGGETTDKTEKRKMAFPDESQEFNQNKVDTIKTCDGVELNNPATKDDTKEDEDNELQKCNNFKGQAENNNNGNSCYVKKVEELVEIAIPVTGENMNSVDTEEDRESPNKRKCDDSEEAQPSAKIAKLESDSEPEPENPDNTAKKSEINTDLIQKILQNPMTSTWESKSHKPYELHNVTLGTTEYRVVKAIFDSTRHSRMTLTKIERIENPYLLGMYLMKKEKMERNRNVEERDLFHGTRKSNLDGICRFNFDWRRKGRSRGHKFGQGVSFSPKASYAHHYNFSDHVMIVAKVLVSQVKEGNYDTVIPPEPYDSTRNHTGDVIVKYSDDDFYPRYIIHYNYREVVFNIFGDTDDDDDDIF